MTWLVPLALAQAGFLPPPNRADLYAPRTEALRRGDVRGFFAVYDPHFTMVDLRGRKMSLREVRSWWTPHIRAKDCLPEPAELRRIDSRGNWSTVQLLWRVHFLAPKHDVSMRLVDVWRQTGAGWKLVSSRALGEPQREVPTDLSFLEGLHPTVSFGVEGKEGHPVADVWTLTFESHQMQALHLVKTTFASRQGWVGSHDTDTSGAYRLLKVGRLQKIVGYQVDPGMLTGHPGALVVSLSIAHQRSRRMTRASARGRRGANLRDSSRPRTIRCRSAT